MMGFPREGKAGSEMTKYKVRKQGKETGLGQIMKAQTIGFELAINSEGRSNRFSYQLTRCGPTEEEASVGLENCQTFTVESDSVMVWILNAPQKLLC
jgi:hypothetical protein